MKPKFLSFRLILLALLMQVTTTQAQEDYQNFDSFDSIATDSMQITMISLSQFKSMNTKEMSYFLEQNNKEIYNKFRRGKMHNTIGLFMLIPSALLIGGGVAIMTNVEHYRYKQWWIFSPRKTITWEYLGGIFVTALGVPIAATSISLNIKGLALTNQAKREFIDKYLNRNYIQPNLNIGYTGNGIGLTINF